VVDDNEMNCEVLKDLLEPEGFVVTTVLDGQEALRIMRREHPDLLLLDMMMPYFSGEDVIKAMQSDQLLKDIPVILITARASDDDRLFGLSLGADDYLAKPIHHEELLFRVKNILHRLDTKQKLVAAEEGQKLAHLGRLMQEYSHELKNVFQMDAFRLNETAQICEKILVRTPLQGPEWAQAAQLFSQEQYLPADQVRFSDLPYTENQQNQSKVLRSVRVNLSLIDMDGQTRLKIWHELLKLSPQEQEECEQTLYIVRNFLVMQHQTLYASELVRNILEYSWANSAEEDASTQVVMENVYRLIRPRLQRLGITMERPTLDHSIAMNQGQLMQVMLNLISNACDAVEPLDKDQKWIRISISEVQDRIVIRCANGGKPLTPEIAETMLQDSWSSKGKNGFGLGLGISLRLIQKAQGLLEINSEASHPEITLSLGSKASMGRRKTA
jgi:DNA-binding response OmpR family regulator